MTVNVDLLSTRQAALALGVSESRVRQLVASGALRPVSLDVPAHFFSREALEAYQRAPRPKRGRPVGSGKKD